jgi:hypothetical protein
MSDREEFFPSGVQVLFTGNQVGEPILRKQNGSKRTSDRTLFSVDPNGLNRCQVTAMVRLDLAALMLHVRCC